MRSHDFLQTDSRPDSLTHKLCEKKNIHWRRNPSVTSTTSSHFSCWMIPEMALVHSAAQGAMETAALAKHSPSVKTTASGRMSVTMKLALCTKWQLVATSSRRHCWEVALLLPSAKTQISPSKWLPRLQLKSMTPSCPRFFFIFYLVFIHLFCWNCLERVEMHIRFDHAFFFFLCLCVWFCCFIMIISPETFHGPIYFSLKF